MTLTRVEAEELLSREALLLDQQAWDEWLTLYCENAVFWVPAWRDETTPTSDPDKELSLVYYESRHNLKERVWRARSGMSVASAPRPRTVHAVTNVLVHHGEDSKPLVTASFTVHLYDVRSERTHVYFGRYEYRLRREHGPWKIVAKKILLLNDVIPTVIDFYAL